MATIINNPPPANQSPAPSNEGGNMVMFITGIIIVIVVVFLFVVYGLPAMRGAKNANNGITVPTTVNVPDKIDVNINK